MSGRCLRWETCNVSGFSKISEDGIVGADCRSRGGEGVEIYHVRRMGDRLIRDTGCCDCRLLIYGFSVWV